MRAYQLPKGGAGIDALTKVERPQPKPAYRQVLIKVAACSLNFRDRCGDYPATMEALLAAGGRVPESARGSEAVAAVLRRHGARG